MIWARWFTPKANDYAGILHPCNRSADLGEVNDAELDRIEGELRSVSAKRSLDVADIRRTERYSMLCEMLPEPTRKYRKAVHEFISETDREKFGNHEGQIKLDGFPEAAMGFTVGLTRDLPRGIVNDTLELVLDPLGSICEFLDGVEPSNTNNYVHQIAKAWQEGDSFSRGRIVGNVTGQVALAVTPAIAKKFTKIPTELGEPRAVKVEPGGIAKTTSEIIPKYADALKYEFNCIENPGPLAALEKKTASNFYAGRYNMEILAKDRIYYRVGEKSNPLGQWFTREPVKSKERARIDLAIKGQWIDPKTGILEGESIIDTMYAIKIPKGTTVYEGPVGYQGGVHLGSADYMQTFINEPWKIDGVEVVSQIP